MGFGEILVWTLAVRSVITGQSLQGRNGEGGRKGLEKSSCQGTCRNANRLSLSSCVSFLCGYSRVCSHLNILCFIISSSDANDGQALMLWANSRIVPVVIRLQRSAVLDVML